MPQGPASYCEKGTISVRTRASRVVHILALLLPPLPLLLGRFNVHDLYGHPTAVEHTSDPPANPSVDSQRHSAFSTTD